MGCFLGCFGGAKDQKRRKHRSRRDSPQAQRNRVRDVHQENVIAGEQSAKEITPTTTDSVAEFKYKPEAEELLSPSPTKQVTFNSQVTTYEHISIHGSVDSLPENIDASVENEKQEDIKSSSHSEDDNSVISNVGSYPSNNRYHNVRDSDDEADEYGDSDLEDLEDENEDDAYNNGEDIDVRISCQEVWSESVLNSSVVSGKENPSPKPITQVGESPILKDQMPREEVQEFGSNIGARDRSDYADSVLNPVENITQWKTVKVKRTPNLKPQKENLFEAPFSNTPCSYKLKSDQVNNANEGLAVDASLSTWLFLPEVSESKKISFSGCETVQSRNMVSESVVTSARSFEDRPILGALTIKELRQISATSSPRKSPSRSPDDMPIIGTVGTYWNLSDSGKQSGSNSSYKGIPNTTSKYREDKRVNWHSTPFETRLDRALKHGTAET